MGYVSGSIGELVKTNFLSIHVSNVLMGVSAGVEVPIITMLGRQLAYSEKGVANFVTLLAVCRVLPGIPSGLLSECFDVRHLMLFATIVQVTGCTMTLALMPNVISLWILSALTGLSIGVFFLTRHIYVARLTKKIYRGITFSCLAGALRWAHVLGPILLGAVATVSKDGRYYLLVPLITAFAAFLCMLIDSLCIRSTRKDRVDDTREDETTCAEVKQLLEITCQKETSEHVILSNKGSVTVPSYDSTTFITSDEKVNNISHNTKTVELLMSQEGDTVMRKTDCNRWLSSLCSTIIERWSVIWRLGFYIILYVALRANRKLLLSFAAMRINFTDSQLAFLLSFSFIFDATLFPLGGYLTDICGRRWTMIPAVLGLGVAFMLLPLLQTPLWLYIMAAVFGAADALGCGLILTLVADHAPKEFVGTFFGVMRTVQDLGHVVGSMIVSSIILKVDFTVSCYLWGAVSVVAALWARFVVPTDNN